MQLEDVIIGQKRMVLYEEEFGGRAAPLPLLPVFGFAPPLLVERRWVRVTVLVTDIIANSLAR